jgi:hypothetical protein
MSRVLVCGSRDWTDDNAIWCVLNGYLHDDMPMTVIEGGARGADRIARVWTRHNKYLPSLLQRVEHLPFPADWAQHGKAAGPIRNQQMLDEGRPDVVWAFVTKPLEQSRGTADMVRRARTAGIPTYVVEVAP